jgi:hypothetical protein
MAWNEKVDKLKAKIKKAAAENDSVAHRNNEEEAKRLELELRELLDRTSALEEEKEGRIWALSPSPDPTLASIAPLNGRTDVLIRLIIDCLLIVVVKDAH